MSPPYYLSLSIDYPYRARFVYEEWRVLETDTYTRVRSDLSTTCCLDPSCE
jgi:hypothetical protein